MNYLKVYESLIAKASRRLKMKGETECHHIKPKCLFPEMKDLRKHPENAVHLTFREHFVAHQLLVKIYPGVWDLVHAASCMSNRKKYGSRRYSWLKELNSKTPRSEEHRKKLGAVHRGKSVPDECKEKISTSLMGYKHTDEAKKNMSDSRSGKKRAPYSPEARANMSAGQTGKKIGPMSEDHRRKISEAHLRRAQKRKLSDSGLVDQDASV